MKHLALVFTITALFCTPLHAESDTNRGSIYSPAKPSKTIEKLSKASANDPAQKNTNEEVPEIKTGDKAEVARIQDYLNSLKTMRADFMQTLSDGTNMNGKVAISRPGKMRLEYDPPNENLLVADGAFVHVWDGQAKTGSSVPLGTSLADIILRDNVKLSGSDIGVTEIKKYPSSLHVTLVQKESPAAGSITLEFQDNPLILKNWRIIDAQGVETRVAIFNQVTDIKIPSSTFFYRDPNMNGGHIR